MRTPEPRGYTGKPRVQWKCCNSGAADVRLSLIGSSNITRDRGGRRRPSLSAPIVLSNPEDLPFSDHLRCFDSFNRRPCRCEGARSLHGSPAAFDVPMIGFDAVVSVARASVAALADTLTVIAQIANGCSVAAVPSIENTRPVVRIR
jgi:hypothetical protein